MLLHKELSAFGHLLLFNGTVRVISNDPSCKDRKCSIHNDTLESRPNGWTEYAENFVDTHGWPGAKNSEIFSPWATPGPSANK